MTDDQAQPTPKQREEREEVEEAIAHALLHKVVTGWRTARMGTYWRKAEVSIEGTVGAEREWARRAAKTIADALRTHSPEEPVDVVAAVRRDDDGMVWLCKRNSDGAHAGLAGMWEYPGGKVEDGEQLRDALVREILEEFPGCIVNVGRVLDSITSAYGGTAYRVTFFEVAMSQVSAHPTHEKVGWFTRDEACALDHLPSGTVFNARHLASPEEPFPVEHGEDDIVEMVARHLLNAVIEDRSFGSDRPKISVARYRQHAKYLLARLRRSAPREAKWQPWATCPRDHRKVLAYFKDGWAETVCRDQDGSWWFAFDGDRLNQDPTHWRPFVGPPIGDES